MTMYGIPENPVYTTNSWLRAWWLHTVWGYKLLDIHKKPRASYFGNLTYDETYRLLPKIDTKQ